MRCVVCKMDLYNHSFFASHASGETHAFQEAVPPASAPETPLPCPEPGNCAAGGKCGEDSTSAPETSERCADSINGMEGPLRCELPDGHAGKHSAKDPGLPGGELLWDRPHPPHDTAGELTREVLNDGYPQVMTDEEITDALWTCPGGYSPEGVAVQRQIAALRAETERLKAKCAQTARSAIDAVAAKTQECELAKKAYNGCNRVRPFDCRALVEESDANKARADAAIAKRNTLQRRLDDSRSLQEGTATLLGATEDRVFTLVKALESVEWFDEGDGHYYCSECCGSKDDGHRNTCSIAAALKAKARTKEGT